MSGSPRAVSWGVCVSGVVEGLSHEAWGELCILSILVHVKKRIKPQTRSLPFGAPEAQQPLNR